MLWDWIRRWWFVLLFSLIALIFLIGLTLGAVQEKEEFMTYCTSKGHTQEDCRWEYKAITRR